MEGNNQGSKTETNSERDALLSPATPRSENKNSAIAKKRSSFFFQQLTLPTTFGLVAWGANFNAEYAPPEKFSAISKNFYMLPQMATFLAVALAGFIAFRLLFAYADKKLDLISDEDVEKSQTKEGILTIEQEKAKRAKIINDVVLITSFPAIVFLLENATAYEALHLTHGNDMLAHQSLLTFGLGMLFGVMIPWMVDLWMGTGKYAKNAKEGALADSQKGYGVKIGEMLLGGGLGVIMFTLFPELNYGIEHISINNELASSFTTGAIYFAYAVFMTILLPAAIKYCMPDPKKNISQAESPSSTSAPGASASPS